MSDNGELDTADCCTTLEEARGVIRRLERSLSKANETIKEWADAADAAMMPNTGEIHCGCVGVLQARVRSLERERDALSVAVARYHELIVRAIDWSIDHQWIVDSRSSICAMQRAFCRLT